MSNVGRSNKDEVQYCYICGNNGNLSKGCKKSGPLDLSAQNWFLGNEPYIRISHPRQQPEPDHVSSSRAAVVATRSQHVATVPPTVIVP